jgi:hypothetical protein
MVSTHAMMKMVRTTGKARQVSAPRKSSCHRIGATLGGMLSRCFGGDAVPAMKAGRAVTTIPIRIAPGTLRMVRTASNKNPNMATSAGGDVRCPARTGAPGTPRTTSPVWFNPIKVRKSPIPVAKLNRRESGTPSTTHWRKRNMVRRMKAIPAMKIAAKAVCQANPSILQTVNATNAFSPIYKERRRRVGSRRRPSDNSLQRPLESWLRSTDLRGFRPPTGLPD